jgi:hypothetical protein
LNIKYNCKPLNAWGKAYNLAHAHLMVNGSDAQRWVGTNPSKQAASDAITTVGIFSGQAV